MNTTLQPAEFCVYKDEASIRHAANSIRASIGQRQFIRPLWKEQPGDERRSETRFCLVTGIFLMPVEVEDGRVIQMNPEEPLFPALTLEISPHGIGIQHEVPLPSKTCVLIFDLWTDTPVTLVVKQRWYRQDHSGTFGHRTGFEIVGVAKEIDQPAPASLCK